MDQPVTLDHEMKQIDPRNWWHNHRDPQAKKVFGFCVLNYPCCNPIIQFLTTWSSLGFVFVSETVFRKSNFDGVFIFVSQSVTGFSFCNSKCDGFFFVLKMGMTGFSLKLWKYQSHLGQEHIPQIVTGFLKTPSQFQTFWRYQSHSKIDHKMKIMIEVALTIQIATGFSKTPSRFGWRGDSQSVTGF